MEHFKKSISSKTVPVLGNRLVENEISYQDSSMLIQFCGEKRFVLLN